MTDHSPEARTEAWQSVSQAAFAQINVSEAEMLRQNFSQVEAIVLEEMKKLGRQLLLTRLQADPRSDPAGKFECTRCHGKLRIQQEEQVRYLETVIGEVEYRRPYGVCDRCTISYAPLDCGLGIPPTGGSITRNQRVCHAAITAGSFEKAADILKVQADIALSDKAVRMISETEGKRATAERRREVAAFQNGGEIAGPNAAPDLIVVAADGGRIRTRQPDEENRGGVWKEDKVGVVYDASPRKDPEARDAEKYEGAKAQTKTFAASLTNWDEFGWMLCVEAMKRGYAAAKKKLFISDGAQSLRTLRQDHFKDATFILDWYHAAEHLSDCAKAAFGEATDEYWAWYKKMRTKLWMGDLDGLIKAIEKESVRVGKPQPKEHESSPRVILHRNIGYFSENRDGMDYPSFRAEGWPIGSGVAEGSVNQFGIRLKGIGKFWNGFGCGLGAEEILALCALHFSEDERWQDYWRRRSQPYTREPRSKKTS
jgi:hypothetical protein